MLIGKDGLAKEVLMFVFSVPFESIAMAFRYVSDDWPGERRLRVTVSHSISVIQLYNLQKRLMYNNR